MNALGVNQYPIRSIVSDPIVWAKMKRERMLFMRRMRYIKNREHIKAKSKAYREKYPEREKERKKKWEAANRDHVNTMYRKRYALRKGLI